MNNEDQGLNEVPPNDVEESPSAEDERVSSDVLEKVPFRTRMAGYWSRHRNLFWWLHSVWALGSGIAVIFLARERYGFVPWVVAFLGLTWASTLFFGSRSSVGEDPNAVPGFGAEFTSWLTRGMFQETLFFLLPFYVYSTVVGSLNVVFPVALGALALFSCVDVIFDRWLRTRPVFGMLFFASVAFAALNLLLPMLVGLDPAIATPVAGGLAVAMAAPIAGQGTGLSNRRELLYATVGGGAVLAVTLFAPALVPPVPLRMESATFARDIDRESLTLVDTLASTEGSGSFGTPTLSRLDGRLVVLVHVFAPASLPTRAHLEWYRDGELLRSSREVDITAHQGGFRIWDAWNPDQALRPGRFLVLVTGSGGRVFGRAEITIRPDAA